MVLSPNVLCLHGFQQDSVALLRKIKNSWGKNAFGRTLLQNFKGLDAPYWVVDDSPDYAKGLQWWSYPPGSDYANPHNVRDTLDECIDMVTDAALQILAKTGRPIDGLLGFSQGGALAARVLEHWAKNDWPAGKPRYGILIAAFDEYVQPPSSNVRDIAVELAHAADIDYSRVDIPMLHVTGSRDTTVSSEFSTALYHAFAPHAKSVLLQHEQAHAIPSASAARAACTDFFASMHMNL